jgi:hypothetical protein
MKVLLFEDNLMWSVRTRNGLEAMGHEVVVAAKPGGELPAADLAIVNLGATSFDPFVLLPRLKARGVTVIGHVGHRDKELWKRGEEAGCDRVVSNGTLANRLSTVVEP